MTDHQPLPVAGYTSVSDAKLEMVNRNKQLEEVVLRKLDNLRTQTEVEIDQRWLAIGRTAIEQAFMAINRSIFQPSRVKLEFDQES